jgi:hypothetical protein
VLITFIRKVEAECRGVISQPDDAGLAAP